MSEISKEKEILPIYEEVPPTHIAKENDQRRIRRRCFLVLFPSMILFALYCFSLGRLFENPSALNAYNPFAHEQQFSILPVDVKAGEQPFDEQLDAKPDHERVHLNSESKDDGEHKSDDGKAKHKGGKHHKGKHHKGKHHKGKHAAKDDEAHHSSKTGKHHSDKKTHRLGKGKHHDGEKEHPSKDHKKGEAAAQVDESANSAKKVKCGGKRKHSFIDAFFASDKEEIKAQGAEEPRA